MSQLGNREPGLVGATLERDDVYAGIIADGIHVHPTSIRIALAAKPKSERIFLVTDAMATAGSQVDSFMINDREVFRKDQRLTLADGTLAGADLEMPRALTVMIDSVRDDLTTAVARATSVPAALLRESGNLGRIGDTLQAPLYFENGFSKPLSIFCV
jgi:N-acetylglucosamine-6-phosphate deacetylase